MTEQKSMESLMEEFEALKRVVLEMKASTARTIEHLSSEISAATKIRGEIIARVDILEREKIELEKDLELKRVRVESEIANISSYIRNKKMDEIDYKEEIREVQHRMKVVQFRDGEDLEEEAERFLESEDFSMALIRMRDIEKEIATFLNLKPEDDPDGAIRKTSSEALYSDWIDIQGCLLTRLYDFKRRAKDMKPTRITEDVRRRLIEKLEEQILILMEGNYRIIACKMIAKKAR